MALHLSSRVSGLGFRAEAPCIFTVDDINPALPHKDPKLWEVWYVPYYGLCRIYIINRRIWRLGIGITKMTMSTDSLCVEAAKSKWQGLLKPHRIDPEAET